MKFLFWQNMISIHQVTLAVQKAFEEERSDSE